MTDLSKTEAPLADLTEWLIGILNADEKSAKSRYTFNPNAPAVSVTTGPDEGWVTVSRGDSDLGTYMTWDEYRSTYCIPAPADPRVLARIAADRQILALHVPTDWGDCPRCVRETSHDDDGVEYSVYESHPCTTTRLLASAYADHPGYQESWKP